MFNKQEPQDSDPIQACHNTIIDSWNEVGNY